MALNGESEWRLFIETRLRSGQPKNRVSKTNKHKRCSFFSKGLDRFWGPPSPRMQWIPVAISPYVGAKTAGG